MTLVLVLAGILFLAVGAFVRAYWSGFAAELGADTARVWAGRRRRRQELRSALAIARSGGAPARILAAVTDTHGVDVVDRVLSRAQRSPGLVALTAAVKSSSSPFVGQVPVVIGIGQNAVPLLRSTLADPQLKTGLKAFAVAAAAPESTDIAIEHASGNLWTQLDAAIIWAQKALSRRDGDFLAIMVSTPITGNWPDDSDLDLTRLFGSIFEDRSRTTWLSYNEPVDVSVWPDEVVVDFPIRADDAARALAESGFPALRIQRNISEKSVIMSAPDAVDLLSLLISSSPASAKRGVALQAAASLPPYSAALTLALEPATQTGMGYVGRDLAAARDIEDVLAASGIRVATVNQGTLLPLSIYRGHVTAWQVPSIAIGVSSSPVHRTGMNTANDITVRWLSQAIASNDEQISAAVLSSHGRAWLEATHPISMINAIRQATVAFPERTRAHLWAHYLLALDSALRLNNPAADWFNQHWCSLADATELGPLFHAERMEFSRLRGEIEAACGYATALMKMLRDNSAAATPTRAYAIGTSNFLLANLLRRGGRYDIAQSFINRGVSLLDEGVPSHRIELQHCRYATSVCESMQGVATVTSGYEWPSGQAVFGRSLVTLANSHAAWFIADHSRAIEFAEEARRGFESIGYQRYATRAEQLANLIANWAELAGTPVMPTLSENALVAELISAKGDIGLLQDLRPSRALSLLQFAVAFAKQPSATREVRLPPCITLTENQEFVPTVPATAPSFKRAERILRGAMGIGTKTRVPLAAD